MLKNYLQKCLGCGAALLVMVSVLAMANWGQAQDVSNLRLPAGTELTVAGPAVLKSSQVQVWVKLVDAPLIAAVGPGTKKGGALLDGGQQRAYVQQLKQKQDSLMSQIRNMGGSEIARVNKAHNAVAVAIPDARVADVAALPGVVQIRPVRDYGLSLGATRSYIGAVAVNNAGYDGTGVVVGVLDSGIDYTHKDFGGPGTMAAYTAAYGTSTTDHANTRRDGLFPTSKVINGYDFVGEVWPNGPLAPDNDPIGCGGPINCSGGHGTHTSDIIGGRSTDGSHKGIAPGVSLVAIKVCSAVSTACSGVALLQGMDFALDPNGDDDISDAVDVINMSLGSGYGQKEDDLSEAAQEAVNFGVVVVASAGNDSDRPYIVGSPSTAPNVLSVAASFHPTAKLYLISPPPSLSTPKGGVWQSWSAPPAVVSAPLVYDSSSAAKRIGCADANGTNPWTPGSHVGQVLLIDRGTCTISMKVSNAAAAGAVAAVIANNVSQPACDLPPTFSFGGGTPNIAGYAITLADGVSLKALPSATPVTINPGSALALSGNMASFSSRGPSMSYNAIKPEITAVGSDILSAEVGTGSG
jgi:subtilisin family serine protease